MDSFEAERDVFGADETGRDLQRPSVVGYVRVSTSEQAGSGAGLEAQRQAIEGEAARRTGSSSTSSRTRECPGSP